MQKAFTKSKKVCVTVCGVKIVHGSVWGKVEVRIVHYVQPAASAELKKWGVQNSGV